MKIAWIADYYIKDHRGGAQTSNDLMIKFGRSLGHEIDELYCSDIYQENIESLAAYDLLIIANMTMLKDDLMTHISDNFKFVRYEHDLNSKDRKIDVFRNARLSVFGSPLHFALYGRALPNVLINPPAIGEFKLNDNIKREKDTCLWVGYLYHGKGIERALQYAEQHPRMRFDFYGHHSHNFILEINRKFNCRYMGFVADRRKLNDIYNKYEAFIHLPQESESFGMTVLEAYLSGCNLIVDKEKIGALSYNWDLQKYDMIKKTLENAPAKFWERIGEVSNGV